MLLTNQKFEELTCFFDPVNLSDLNVVYTVEKELTFQENIVINSTEAPIKYSEKFEVAIIALNQHKTYNADKTREQLYGLSRISPHLRICDLGNLRTGKTFKDALYAISEVNTICSESGIVTIFIGGQNQELTIGSFDALCNLSNDLHVSLIDSRADIQIKEKIDKDSYLNTIIRETSSLYNISLIGYQNYFVDKKYINILNENYFEHYRLGVIRENIKEIEPVLRDADLLSVDISAVRVADAPAQIGNSPNGLYGEEVCQLVRYSGMSDKMKSLMLFGMSSNCDKKGVTSQLYSQIIWYFIDGYYNRKKEYPVGDIKDCIRYSVEIEELDFPIVFYKSEKTERWWIEIGNIAKKTKDQIKIIIPCSFNDYLKAGKNEIPERWWQNFKKLN